jgi:Tol biopolymer transport system component
MPVNIPRALLVIVLLAAGGSWHLSSNAQGVTEAERQLQKAILLETVDGNLQAAIDQYKKIVAENGSDRVVAARALLRLAGCYEKFGDTQARQARTAYERVVREFGDQADAAAEARIRLAALTAGARRLTAGIETAADRPTFRKIRTPFNIPLWSGSRLSPDGKTLAFGSDKGIWIVPIPGRVDADLAGEPKELAGASDALGDGLSWSGDGRWIAFSPAYARGQGSRIDFRPEQAYIDVVPSSGGKSRRIAVPQWVAWKGNEMGRTSRRLSLSPDGRTVVFDAGGQIFRASVDTGNIEQITKEGGSAACVSPDGQKIAYLRPGATEGNAPPRLVDVMVIPADRTGSPAKVNGQLNEGLASTGPSWSPDGRMLAFFRYVAGPPLHAELCIVRVSEQGGPLGSPVQIALPLITRNSLAGWTPDNRIGLLLETPYHEYVYTIPVSGGKATQVTPLDRLAGIPRWSPDGKRLFFRSQGGGLGVVSADGGEVTAHPQVEAARKTGLFTVYPGAGNSVSPDGKTVVFAAGTATYGPNLYAVPVEGGEPKQIASMGRYPCWSPDGRWIAYLGPDDTNEDRPAIYKMSPDGREVLRISGQSDYVVRGGIDWSPDGRWVAYFSRMAGGPQGSLRLISTEGGAARQICQISDVSAHSDVSWSPDGQQLAFVSRGKIWVVPASGGEPVEVKTDVDAAAGKLDWSPDGRKIAFSGESGMENEFWFMENFLAVAKEAPGASARQIKK